MDFLRKLFGGKLLSSEGLVINLLLAFSGGFQDAYTYIARGQVFANAQTGNIVLMSTYFMQKNYAHALRYIFPLFAFAAGIFVASQIENKIKIKIISWKQVVIFLEIITLFIVGIIPENYNIIANMLVSFSCAMQVQTFRKIRGKVYASTMCIGNIRSGTEAFSKYIINHDRKFLSNSKDYLVVVIIFALGAGIGGNLSAPMGLRTIWLSCAILFAALVLIERNNP